MIKDTLENAETYYNISQNLQTAFEWLKSTDLQQIEDGRYEIKGDDIFANVQSYTTKDNAPYEAHRKYTDIQYMINGVEKVGVSNYKLCSTTEEYNKEKDIEFLDCKAEKTYQKLEEHNFLVFFPQDAHQPSLDYGKKMNVKKVIVKVKL